MSLENREASCVAAGSIIFRKYHGPYAITSGRKIVKNYAAGADIMTYRLKQ